MTDRLRLLTLNLLTRLSADGPAREEVVRQTLAGLEPHVVAFQEVTRSSELDQAAGLLGPAFTIVGLPGGDPTYGTECLATRCPVVRVAPLDRAVRR